jgi:hypothetical protein
MARAHSNSHSAGQPIPSLILNPKVHCRVHNSPRLTACGRKKRHPHMKGNGECGDQAFMTLQQQ